MAVVIPGAR